jgi:hypothetical protein
MAAPKRKTDRDALFEAVTNRDGLVCFMCGTAHSRASTMMVTQIDHDDEDVTNSDNAIMACKTCVRSRDKRPLMAYMKLRFNAAKAEVAYLSDLKENIRVQRILTVPIIMGDYAPSITTPNAVGITGSTDEPKPEFDEDLAHLSRDQQREARAAPDYVLPSARPGYAPRITTPNAVDGTGSTMTEDQAKKLSEMIAAMNDDDA